MVTGTTPRARRRLARASRSCRGAPSADDAGSISACATGTPRQSSSPGTSAIARPTARAEPNCQSLAGAPLDEAVGLLVAEKMTPAAVELALEIRKEIEARYDEADQLRCRAIERAQVDADLAQRRFMMVDPGNRLVADTLEADWNEKLRALAKARDERERARREDQIVIDDAIRERLVAMTTDFKRLWSDPSTPNRERKRMLAYVVEDATLVKLPHDGTTKIHVRFRGGQTTTLTTVNPKASWQKVKTPTEIVELVDQLLDDHLYDEIAEILNARGLRPGGSAWPGRAAHDLRRSACSTSCTRTASACASIDCELAGCSPRRNSRLVSESTSPPSRAGSNTASSRRTRTTGTPGSTRSRRVTRQSTAADGIDSPTERRYYVHHGHRTKSPHHESKEV